MLGKRSPQRGMFAVSASTIGEADHLYLDFVGPDTFYGFLYCRDLRWAQQRPAQPAGDCSVAALARTFGRCMTGYRMRRPRRVQTMTCAGR